MHDLVSSFHGGDWREALRLQLKVNPLVAALFCEVSPVPIKAALQMMGLCEETVRLPLVPMLPENKARLLREMKTVGLL
jgi:4-hydroxy-tetrahydrodipicolinate synthase